MIIHGVHSRSWIRAALAPFPLFPRVSALGICHLWFLFAYVWLSLVEFTAKPKNPPLKLQTLWMCSN
jgi:hypothetical protein